MPMKMDGKEYEPEFLKVMIAAIDQYVREKRWFYILKDEEFLSVKKGVDLQSSGIGIRPRTLDVASFPGSTQLFNVGRRKSGRAW